MNETKAIYNEATIVLLRKGKFTLLDCCGYTTNSKEEATELFKQLYKLGYRSREDAANAGELHYFLGGCCKHGHKATRYTKSGICVECHQGRIKAYNEKVKAVKSNLITIKYKIHPDDRPAFDDLAESLRIARALK
ncbi:MAG: hypothetical protein KAJ10_03660 [Thermodesulfovibrionia bacterium]|nr:hypothetical protein [Thermodesulfovibrionia bacterium]